MNGLSEATLDELANLIADRVEMKLAYTPKKAAAMLSISERKLWEIQNRGDIRPVRIDRSVRYLHSELERYLGTLNAQD